MWWDPSTNRDCNERGSGLRLTRGGERREERGGAKMGRNVVGMDEDKRSEMCVIMDGSHHKNRDCRERGWGSSTNR